MPPENPPKVRLSQVVEKPLTPEEIASFDAVSDPSLDNKVSAAFGSINHKVRKDQEAQKVKTKSKKIFDAEQAVADQFKKNKAEKLSEALGSLKESANLRKENQSEIKDLKKRANLSMVRGERAKLLAQADELEAKHTAAIPSRTSKSASPQPSSKTSESTGEVIPEKPNASEEELTSAEEKQEPGKESAPFARDSQLLLSDLKDPKRIPGMELVTTNLSASESEKTPAETRAILKDSVEELTRLGAIDPTKLPGHSISPKETLRRREERAETFAKKFNIAAQRDAMLAAEKEAFEEAKDFHKHYVKVRRLTASKKYNEAVLAWSKALTDATSGEGITDRERLEALAIRKRDTIIRPTETRVNARREAMDERGKTLTGKAINWSKSAPLALAKGYNSLFSGGGKLALKTQEFFGAKKLTGLEREERIKQYARAGKIVSSAAIGTALALGATPVSVGGGLLTFALYAGRGVMGTAVGAGAGYLGKIGYRHTIGKSNTKEYRASARREISNASDLKAQQEAYKKGNRDTRIAREQAVGMITALVGGMGFTSLTAPEIHHIASQLAHNKSVEDAAAILSHPPAHGVDHPGAHSGAHVAKAHEGIPQATHHAIGETPKPVTESLSIGEHVGTANINDGDKLLGHFAEKLHQDYLASHTTPPPAVQKLFEMLGSKDGTGVLQGEDHSSGLLHFETDHGSTVMHPGDTIKLNDHGEIVLDRPGHPEMHHVLVSAPDAKTGEVSFNVADPKTWHLPHAHEVAAHPATPAHESAPTHEPVAETSPVAAAKPEIDLDRIRNVDPHSSEYEALVKQHAEAYQHVTGEQAPPPHASIEHSETPSDSSAPPAAESYPTPDHSQYDHPSDSGAAEAANTPPSAEQSPPPETPPAAPQAPAHPAEVTPSPESHPSETASVTPPPAEVSAHLAENAPEPIQNLTHSPMWEHTKGYDASNIFNHPAAIPNSEADIFRQEMFSVLRESGIGPKDHEVLSSYLERASHAIQDNLDKGGKITDIHVGIYQDPQGHLFVHGGDSTARVILANEYIKNVDPSAELNIESAEGVKDPFMIFHAVSGNLLAEDTREWLPSTLSPTPSLFNDTPVF
ncbi:hypothetical protein H0X32_01930 [Patescibacteria group bacterium]|nr:hypothetical protein [Patescibacteria group bacterium]